MRPTLLAIAVFALMATFGSSSLLADDAEVTITYPSSVSLTTTTDTDPSGIVGTELSGSGANWVVNRVNYVPHVAFKLAIDNSLTIPKQTICNDGTSVKKVTMSPCDDPDDTTISYLDPGECTSCSDCCSEVETCNNPPTCS